MHSGKMVNKKDEKEFAIVPACPTMITSERRQGATGARSPKTRISSMLPVAYQPMPHRIEGYRVKVICILPFPSWERRQKPKHKNK
jgi:hypothetical protein